MNFNTLFVDKSEVPEVLRTVFFKEEEDVVFVRLSISGSHSFCRRFKRKKKGKFFVLLLKNLENYTLCVDAREEVTAPGVGSDCGLRRRKFSGFFIKWSLL